MSEDALKRCPRCRSKVRRLFGPGAGIIFKGSGFYETDYRSASYKEAARKEATPDKGTEGGTKKEKETAPPETAKGASKPKAEKE